MRGTRMRSNYFLNILKWHWLWVALGDWSLTSTGWPKSHFTLLKANKSKPNRAKKVGYISNERLDLGVFFRYLVFHFNKMEQHHIARETIEEKKINFFFSNFFFLKGSNLYERCGIG